MPVNPVTGVNTNEPLSDGSHIIEPFNGSMTVKGKNCKELKGSSVSESYPGSESETGATVPVNDVLKGVK